MTRKIIWTFIILTAIVIFWVLYVNKTSNEMIVTPVSDYTNTSKPSQKNIQPNQDKG